MQTYKISKITPYKRNININLNKFNSADAKRIASGTILILSAPFINMPEYSDILLGMGIAMIGEGILDSYADFKIKEEKTKINVLKPKNKQ